MRALVTGFEPFGGSTFNPSGELIGALSRNVPTNSFEDFTFVVLPTAYRKSRDGLLSALRKNKPDQVIMFGQAAKSTAFTLEQVALNRVDANKADNDGENRFGQPVVAGAPLAHASSLPLPALRRALSLEFPVEISSYAGGFVCNATYFNALNTIASEGMMCQALFIHVPLSLITSVKPEIAARLYRDGELWYLESFARALLRLLRLGERAGAMRSE